MAVRAVIFDCFGVLVTDGWSPFLHRHFHDQPAQRAVAAESGRLVDAGLKDYQTHLVELAEQTGLTAQAVQQQIDSNQANQQLFEYIDSQLADQYKLGLLSNAGANWLERLFLPEQRQLFDEVVLSCDIGVTKPHPAMYETMASRLGVLPEECLFIDDVAAYAAAAEAVGMQAIVFQTTAQTIADMTEQLSA